MTHRIIWTDPVMPGAAKEQQDSLRWDSRDMAQLAAILMEGPQPNPNKYRAFRVEENKGAQRGKA